jgi:hypothetical protein
MAMSEPVKEALDHLLDPLDLSRTRQQTVEDEDITASPMRSDGMGRSRVVREAMADYLLRLRRSRRLPYRIPRLVGAWTALIIGVFALIWITFGAVGLR